MATLLDITNRVLRRLREDQVTDLTEDYPLLVAEFISDIAQEVNEAGLGWSALDHTVDVTLADGTRTYALTASNSKSLLCYTTSGDPMVWLFDNGSDTTGAALTQLDMWELERMYQENRTLANVNPTYFAIEPDTAFDALQIKFFPEPDATRLVRVRLNTPESVLTPDDDALVEVKVPNRVVYLGALYLALNERGEELGEPGGVAERRYITSLGAAIEEEVRKQERLGRHDWYRN